MTSNEAAKGLLELYLKQLKLPGIAQVYPELIREAINTDQSHLNFLLACLGHEVETRQERQLQKRLKQAKFPWVKGVGNFDFTVIPKLPKQKVLALAEGRFVPEKENVAAIP